MRSYRIYRSMLLLLQSMVGNARTPQPVEVVCLVCSYRIYRSMQLMLWCWKLLNTGCLPCIELATHVQCVVIALIVPYWLATHNTTAFYSSWQRMRNFSKVLTETQCKLVNCVWKSINSTCSRKMAKTTNISTVNQPAAVVVALLNLYARSGTCVRFSNCFYKSSCWVHANSSNVSWIIANWNTLFFVVVVLVLCSIYLLPRRANYVQTFVAPPKF